MKTRLIILGILFLNAIINAQPYTDYIGAGHTRNIVVTASGVPGPITNSPLINGAGLDAKFNDASRFIAQATFGGDSAVILSAMNMGYENWINDQFNKPKTFLLPIMNSIWTTVKQKRIEAGQPEEDIFGPWALHFNYAFWDANIKNVRPGKNNDLLRQRVANALSEILVVSRNSDLGDWGDALTSYYDILIDHSFGNYLDLLKAVSKSVPMGYYLSHLNNPKTNIAQNIRPDENYAREIMQLFTIGLVKLNPDGTEVLDANGFPIPTYTNYHIKEMAKIFTGLHGSQTKPCPVPPYPPQCTCYAQNNPPICNNYENTCCWWPTGPSFGLDPYFLVKTAPMIMSNANHEPGPKTMPDNTTIINIPGDGMAEVDAAITFLFNHSNTPPFISKRLIQRLVKSNPSPAYVQRVAAKFINNGSGVRGDMKAVIKAILLDPEARSGNYVTDFSNGMLRNPTLRYLQFCLANTLDSDLDRFWNNGFSFYNDVLHHPLFSPTVFNFYTPDHAPIGPVKSANLVGPEFKILNSSSSKNMLNTTHGWVSPWMNNDGEAGWVMYSWEEYNGIDLDSTVHLITTKYENIATENEKLINELNKVFAHGQLSDSTLNILRNIATTIDNNTSPSNTWWFPQYKRHKVRNLLYFLLASPDYVILK